VIEKHFSLGRDLPGPDHGASLEPEQLDELVDRIRRAESAMGHGQKFPTDEEKANAEVMRKSICLARPVDEGEVLTDEDIAILRPGTGIAPKNRASVLGSRLRQTYPKGTPIQEQMLADDT
jgi:N,N'-diacetyllegionaminate synthase